ncbi:MAG: division/cell wall cluster transcriptional repressor MraZ [Gammaproteobacteria bacterium]|jgi:MraZ protein|nr:MAG: division/cell wall cluster transcriptional repressor MraZ [Gammaproteobacteria bacterium]
MFQGINDLNLDAKGRMSLPARYRESIQESCDGSLVITVDVDRCLLIYPLPEWEVIQQKLMQLPSINKQVRRLQRLLLGHATECDVDGNNRILLPPPLRNFADLKKHAVLIGQGNKFELWDQDTWEKMRERWLKEESKLSDITGALETLSI